MSLMSDDDFNDEIVEIFVEEVDEVLSLIDENFAIWKDNADNDAALKEIRRAFHTLKGSGRMVQAEEIGELAWSIENLLNRVLDKTLVFTPSVYDLVSEVRDSVPTLVDAFKNKQAAALAGVNVGQMIEQAEGIMSGKAAVGLDSAAASSPDIVVQMHSETDSQEEIKQLNKQITELKRDLLTVSTQLDTLSTKFNVMPQATTTEEVDGKLSQFSDDLGAMQQSIEQSAQQLSKSADDTSQKLASKFEKDLKDVSDLTGQLKADFNHEVEQLSSTVNGIAIKWSVVAVVTSLVIVYAFSHLV